MISELELKIIEEKLNTNEYIPIASLSFPRNNDEAWGSAILTVFAVGFIGFIIFVLLLINCGDSDNDVFIPGFVLCGTPILALVLAIVNFYRNYIPKNFIKKARNMKEKINEHNQNVYDNLLQLELTANEIDNFTKKISLRHLDFVKDEVLGVNDDDKYLAYYNLEFNSSTSKFAGTVQKIEYCNIIKYELIDNSTTSQTATSITSSNAGKALGGAIISDLLVGNSATGAIIGGSGQRKTETTFKNSVKNSYQIVIYLNSLENSTITINTKYRNKVNDIISILEYILRNQN